MAGKKKFILILIAVTILVANCKEDKAGGANNGNSGNQQQQNSTEVKNTNTPARQVKPELPPLPNKPAVPTAKVSDVELRVVGNSEFMGGSRGAVRMMAVNPVDESPIEGAAFDIQLAKFNDGAPKLIYTGLSDAQGTANAVFTVPAESEPGNYKLIFTARTVDRKESMEQAVTLKNTYAIYLSTDKPIYQPGQTIYIRTLALARPLLRPLANKELTFTVEDGRANRVFKSVVKTNDFGVASAIFTLASEVNIGAFKIKAELEKTAAEKTVNVERYVLPKFKVKVETDKSFYRPGEKVSGSVQADYLFGKPVSDSDVEIRGSSATVGEQVFFSFQGKTDKDGHLKFETKIPDFLVGQDLLAGKAFISFHAIVEDKAQHREEGSKQVSAGSQELTIDIIPEGGALAPNLPNTVFVVVSDADGMPAEDATVNLSAGAKTHEAKVNRLGIARFTIKPEGNVDAVVKVVAKNGAKAELKKSLPALASDDYLVTVMENVLYRSGDKVNVVALSTVKQGSVFVDMVRDGQTVWTSVGELKDGKAEWSFDLPPDLFGTVTMNAYVLKKNMNFVRTSRLLMVQPAQDLLIKISAEKQSYKPGEEAEIKFAVSDNDGNPITAALGLYIVDEAVFAKAEAAPGLEKVFFLLEKEIMTPRYEIHGLSFNDLVKPAIREKTQSEDQQVSARVILAAAGEAPSSEFSMTSKKEKIRTAMLDAYKKVMEAVAKYREKKGTFKGSISELVNAGFLMSKDLKDPFGREYIMKPCSCGSWDHGTRIISLGPDGKEETEDDITLYGSNYISGWLFGAGEGGGGPVPVGIGVGGAGLGGFGGRAGKLENAPMRKAMGAVPMAAPVMEAEDKAAMSGALERDVLASTSTTEKNGEGYAAVGRVREFFPETLFVNPSLITDEKGIAIQKLTVADSITTWRIVATGSSKDGLLGAENKGMKVFQDFFIDPDLPLALTVGDEISLPIAVHNYLSEPQKVQLKLGKEDWLELSGDDTQTVEIGPNDVKGVSFRIKALKPGTHKIYVEGRGTKLADAVRKEVEVVPNGFAVPLSISDTLDKDLKQKIEIPGAALTGGTSLWLRFYPGVFSQVVDGMEKILRMPSGCFEQTSSATYPNILVLDYMKRTGKVTPEIQMQAETYIANGYQRLLTFEVNGGGFSWFGDAPANQVLTAYGLMEFTDMSRVRDVDQNMINRTKQWLFSRQKDDGSWEPDKSYLHAESWSKIQGKNQLVTAYILWALAETGDKSPQTNKGLEWLSKHIGEANDAYTLALAASAFLVNDPKNATGKQLLDRLAAMAKNDGDSSYWEGEATVTYASGKSADVETTALCTYALIKGGAHNQLINRTLKYIIQNKDSYGTWHSTNATIMALRTLLGSKIGSAGDTPKSVAVKLDGKEAGKIEVTKNNSDVVQQIDLGKGLEAGSHEIEIKFKGDGAMMYQIAGRYYLPWNMKQPEPKEVIALDVNYEREKLAQNETIDVKVKAALNIGNSAKMVMIDIGVPPGFDVNTPDLTALVEKKIIQRFSQTPRQVMIYVEEISAGKPLEFSFTMRARYPIRASVPESQAYMYYNPDEKSVQKPKSMEVIKK